MRNKKIIKREAKKKVEELFFHAESVFSSDKTLANRYVNIARKIAMKVNLRLPSKLKRKFCKHCYSFLMPGFNCRIRTRDNKVVYYCLECKKFMRFPFLKEKKLRKTSKLNT